MGGAGKHQMDNFDTRGKALGLQPKWKEWNAESNIVWPSYRHRKHQFVSFRTLYPGGYRFIIRWRFICFSSLCSFRNPNRHRNL